MYFGVVICGLLLSFALGIVFAFTIPVWLVIILQAIAAFGLSCCIFKKR